MYSFSTELNGDFNAVENKLVGALKAEGFGILTPADVYYGRGQSVLDRREKTKLKTLAMRRQMHYDRCASQSI